MQFFKIFGGIALVSFTTIGGGILALPTNTYQGGFLPTSLSFCFVWFFMTIAALLILELCLKNKRGADLITIADNSLGTLGKFIAWLGYLFLVYALICAYLTATGAWLSKLIFDILFVNIDNNIAVITVSLGTSIVLFLGTRIADYFNRLFAIGVIIAYLSIVYIALPSVDSSSFKTLNINTVPNTIPLILTTFGFGIVIPTLTDYFNRDRKTLLFVILVGSTIPLIVYILWEYICLGTLSISGSMGLEYLAKNKADSTEVAIAMETILGNKKISLLAKLFSVCAILTSLIGVSLSLYHFLADGFKIKKKGINKVFLSIMTFIPPLLIVLLYSQGFDKILSFGGIFVAILLGILPIAMYWQHTKSCYCKILLTLTAIFFIYVIFQELTQII